MLGSLKCLCVRGLRCMAAHAPEILMGLGTVGVVTGTVVIAKQSLKLEDALQEINDMQYELKAMKDQMDEKKYKKELLQIKKAAALKVAKMYLPGAALVTAGMVCFFAAFGKVKKENGLLAASLAAANKAFEEYRQRVIEDQGQDKDREYLYGLKKETIER